MAGGKMLEVHFRLMSEHTQTMFIMSDATVSQAKVLLGAVIDTAAENQRFIFKGQMLQNDNTLEHYGVDDGSTVHVVSKPSDPHANVGAPQESGDASNTADAPRYMAGALPCEGVYMGGLTSIPVGVANIIPVATQTGSLGFAHARGTRVNVNTEPNERDEPRAMFSRFHCTREFMDKHGGPAGVSQIAADVAANFFNNLASGNIDFGDDDTDGNDAGADANFNQVATNQGDDAAENAGVSSAGDLFISDAAKDKVAQCFGAAKNQMDTTLEKLDGNASTNGPEENNDAQNTQETTPDANTSPIHHMPGVFQIAAMLPWATLQGLESLLDLNEPDTRNAAPCSATLCHFISRCQNAQSRALTLVTRVALPDRLQAPPVQARLAEKCTLAMAMSTQLYAELTAFGSSLFPAEFQASPDIPASTSTAGQEPHMHAPPIVETIVSTSPEPRRFPGDWAGDEEPLHTFTNVPTFAQRLEEAAKPKSWTSAYMGQDNTNQST